MGLEAYVVSIGALWSYHNLLFCLLLKNTIWRVCSFNKMVPHATQFERIWLYCKPRNFSSWRYQLAIKIMQFDTIRLFYGATQKTVFMQIEPNGSNWRIIMRNFICMRVFFLTKVPFVSQKYFFSHSSVPLPNFSLATLFHNQKGVESMNEFMEIKSEKLRNFSFKIL